MGTTNRDGIRRLLKGIETGDPESVQVVNEDRYVQHNPMTEEGSPGLADLFARLAKTQPSVVLHRMFEDGDFVFGHVEYDFDQVAVGFEMFRFEDGQAVEHWDNLQRLHPGPNLSGRTMTDGPTATEDLDKTAANKQLVESFANEVLLNRTLDRLGHFVGSTYAEHSPGQQDGVEHLRSYLERRGLNGELSLCYSTLHRVLAEGNMVLCASEGTRDGIHVAIYDLFRVANSQIVEHWDSIEGIAPVASWRNTNGKF